MKILNLYSGLGGNRKEWNNCQVTAVEQNELIAKVYSKYFPQDKIIIGDAHEFLLNNYKDYDFIWSSRSCITHSRTRMWASKGGKYPPVYPDMGLYQEIIFLDNFFEGEWIVENVIPYYDLEKMLIKPTIKIGRHLIWTNMNVPPLLTQEEHRDHNKVGQTIYGFDLTNENVGQRKDQVIRNCMNPQIGLHILNCSTNVTKRNETNTGGQSCFVF